MAGQNVKHVLGLDTNDARMDPPTFGTRDCLVGHLHPAYHVQA